MSCQAAAPLIAVALIVGCASSAEYMLSAAPASYGFDGVAEISGEAYGGARGVSANVAAPGAPPEPAPAAPAEPTDAPDKPALEAAKRLVIYTGSLSLLVPQADPAVKAFLAEVDAKGGYLQSRLGTTVTVRVPAAEFFPTVERLRGLGQVTAEQINARDVTKRVFDLELRQRTAEDAHKRLLKLLESATKMEDFLAIEAQLRRLTDEIEAMKGELRSLGDQVAFSTLTVAFDQNAPSATPYPTRTRSRFEWVNQVGIERVLGVSSEPEGEGCASLHLDVPAGFLVTHDAWGSLLALSPDESKLWVHDFDDADKGALSFWRDALKADLNKSRGYTIIEEGSLKDGAGREGVSLLLETALSGRPVRELLVVFVVPGLFDNTIRVVEFVADKDAFATGHDAVRAAVATLR